MKFIEPIDINNLSINEKKLYLKLLTMEIQKKEITNQPINIKQLIENIKQLLKNEIIYNPKFIDKLKNISNFLYNLKIIALDSNHTDNLFNYQNIKKDILTLDNKDFKINYHCITAQQFKKYYHRKLTVKKE